MNVISKYRKKAKLTQVMLAKELEVRQSTVAMWECGKNFPNIKNLMKMAGIFRCSIEELIAKTNSENRKGE